MNSQIKIYCLPGIGLDERLFSRLHLPNAQLIHLKWETTVAHEKMETYAQKIAKQIKTDEPFYLLGVSFGGMVCVELAELVKPQKTFIISSAKGAHELPWYLSLLKFIPAHLLFGERFYRWLSKSAWRLIGIKKEDKELFFDMVESPPRPYYKGAVNCIVTWRRKTLPQNIVHIHGDKDYILPIRFVRCDVIIKAGTHAMIAYQAEEIGGKLFEV